MNDNILSADLRKQSSKLTRQAYLQSVDDLLFEATMEAEHERRQERGQADAGGPRR